MLLTLIYVSKAVQQLTSTRHAARNHPVFGSAGLILIEEVCECGDLLARDLKRVGARAHAPLPVDRPPQGIVEAKPIAPAQFAFGLRSVEGQ
jgi:hypothetical protein